MTHRLRRRTAGLLADAGLDPNDVVAVITRALDEDLDGGVDVTSAATIPAGQRSVLDLTARRPGIVAGAPVAGAVFELVGGTDVAWSIGHGDGAAVVAGDVVVTAHGPTRSLLTAERTALNLLTHCSGIATATGAWVAALAGSGARVRDTRKTTPGLRRLDKYAVRCGGGLNHRMSLSDAALVKDNHVIAAGGVVAAFTRVREQFPGIPIEVEVDSLDQLDEVVAAGADLVLLDNFTPEQMRVAVGRVRGRCRLEASGGLTLTDAAAVGATGVDFVAVGALTHSASSLDIGADLRDED